MSSCAPIVYRYSRVTVFTDSKRLRKMAQMIFEDFLRHRLFQRTVGSLFVVMSLSACDDFDPAPVEFSQEDIIAVGNIQTLEVRQRVLASLPEEAQAVDAKQAELGRLLFWDPILSGDSDVACATCHLPEAGYSDNQHQAIGVGGVGRAEDRTVGSIGRVPRNSQTVLNTAWNGINELGVFDPVNAPMFWDNRTKSLELQAIEPIRSREEMRGDNVSESDIDELILSRLNSIPEYRSLFSDAFAVDSISIENVAAALANFQRTLVANNSAFDRWMRGEPDAMTDQQLSGMQEFVIAGCADCHSGPLFSDFLPHVLGVQEGIDVTEPDSGTGNFAFRTPTLRQLKFTAPYFHAGQFTSLAAAVDFYDERRASNNPNVANEDLDVELLEVPEMDDGRGAIIMEFLDALNDASFDQRIPESVPSGLLPGGFN